MDRPTHPRDQPVERREVPPGVARPCRELSEPTARLLRGRKTSGETLESCAFEGESLSGCISDLRSESDDYLNAARMTGSCGLSRGGAQRYTQMGFVRVSPTSLPSCRRILPLQSLHRILTPQSLRRPIGAAFGSRISFCVVFCSPPFFSFLIFSYGCSELKGIFTVPKVTIK